MSLTIDSKDDFNSIMLSSRVSIGKYLNFVKQEDRESIAKFVHERFSERYITPLESTPKKNGFCIMANCCLMIEALESFYQGWGDTQGRSELAFCEFFDRAKEFWDFRGCSSEFYRNVRCAILHQAESTGGWRIRRTGPLFNPDTLTINATIFLRRLKKYLKEYQEGLKKADWNSGMWNNLRKKMNTIINNCKRV